MKESNEVHIQINNPSVKSAENFIKMVGIGDLLGMILIGPAGMGKTQLVSHTLESMDIPYIKYGGHITLATIYEYLYENRTQLIFFDDCSQIIENTEIMELLKQALQVSCRARELHYRSMGTKTVAPKKFAFTGRIIMAFNTMDKKNPNVRAIVDRAPMIELKYSRKEIYDAMYQIAQAQGGGLREDEKLIITREIEKYTSKDSTMHVSLRSQQIAFNVYRSFKTLYGDTNTEWKEQIQRIFGKVKESWIRELIRELVGEGKLSRKELAKQISIRKDMSLRNAYRKIIDHLECEDIYSNKENDSDVSLNAFKCLFWK